MVPRHRTVLLTAILLLAGTPGHAQLGGRLGGGLGGGLGGLPGTGTLQGPLGTINRATANLDQDVRGTLDTVRRDLVGRPLQPRALDRDPQGAAIVKNQILAVSPSAESLTIARRLNFRVLRQDRLDGLGLSSVTLQAPDGMSEISALSALRAADPAGSYDYAHVYSPTGDGVTGTSASSVPLSHVDVIRIGMIDGGVEKRHPALADKPITTRSFVGKGDAPPSQHGTAIASLLVGKDGPFSGYLPGAKLYAADVFGGEPDGGSAADIARALNWLAENRIPVTNISLAGPNNALLAAAVKAFVASGHVLVAAVGNDGPAAPPNYPAAYEGVIAVTSVDADGRLEIDANHNVARFAARGVGVRAASLPRGYAGLTGTSYAVPAVAAQFALLVDKPDAETARASLNRVSQEATPIQNAGLLFVAAPQAAVTAAR
jgi:subtilisin family serine protease